MPSPNQRFVCFADLRVCFQKARARAIARYVNQFVRRAEERILARLNTACKKYDEKASNWFNSVKDRVNRNSSHIELQRHAIDNLHCQLKALKEQADKADHRWFFTNGVRQGLRHRTEGKEPRSTERCHPSFTKGYEAGLKGTTVDITLEPDRYVRAASVLYNVPVEQVTQQQRANAKAATYLNAYSTPLVSTPRPENEVTRALDAESERQRKAKEQAFAERAASLNKLQASILVEPFFIRDGVRDDAARRFLDAVRAARKISQAEDWNRLARKVNADAAWAQLKEDGGNDTY